MVEQIFYKMKKVMTLKIKKYWKSHEDSAFGFQAYKVCNSISNIMQLKLALMMYL